MARLTNTRYLGKGHRLLIPAIKPMVLRNDRLDFIVPPFCPKLKLATAALNVKRRGHQLLTKPD